MDLVRLITVHPALVHFTIGALPIVVLAYLMASWRKSPRWSFTGDVALLVTAVITLATTVFGLVSFLVVSWPGGLMIWRWLHLALGALSTVLLIALVIYRARARRTETHSGAFTLASAVVVAAVVFVTGWIGGEVLVFRAGVAVEAAGNGALSPTVWTVSEGEPDDIVQAMDRIRPRWAELQTTVAEMVVQEPTEEQFELVERRARELQALGAWMESYDQRSRTRVSQQLGAILGAGVGDPAASASDSETFAEDISSMSVAFTARVGHVIEKAEARDIRGVTGALGRLTQTCASCHHELRWGTPLQAQDH